jgi:hypothetical protein
MVQIPEPAEGPGISSFWEASAQMPRQQAPPAPDPQEHRNKAKELENLQRVFDWCSGSRLQPAHAASQLTRCALCARRRRLDKKGDKRIDAEELAIHLKFLGCAIRNHHYACSCSFCSHRLELASAVAGSRPARRTWRT